MKHHPQRQIVLDMNSLSRQSSHRKFSDRSPGTNQEIDMIGRIARVVGGSFNGDKPAQYSQGNAILADK